MQFCILSPVPGLHQYSTLSRNHLILAQIEDKAYEQFYRTRRQEGDHVILDNGAWEGEVNTKRLLDAINFYQPNVVVLPDHLLEPWQKTYHSSQIFLDRYYDQFPDISWAYCPQSTRRNPVGWIEGLVKGLEDSRIGWICLPRALGTDITTDPLFRANCCRFIKRRGRRVHALGMLSGSVNELAFLRDAGCDSIDSNAPVFRGWHGYRLGQKCPKLVYDYSNVNVLTESNAEIIRLNLEDCGVNTSTIRAGKRNGVQGQTSISSQISAFNEHS